MYHPSYFFYVLIILIFAIINSKDLKNSSQQLSLKTISLIGIVSLLTFSTVYMFLFILKDNPSHLVSAIAYSAPVFTLI